jgi:peroxiredoxin
MRLHFIFFLSLLFQVIKAETNPNADPKTTVSISGTVSSPAFSEAKILLFNDPMQYAESHYYLTFQGNNRFSLNFSLGNAQFAEFQYGDQSAKIWLEPGEKLDIYFDGQDFFHTLKYEGQGSAANNFLKEFQEAFPDLAQKIEATMSVSDANNYKKYILDLSVQRSQFMLNNPFFSKSPQDFQLFFTKNENYWTGFQLLRYAFDKPLFDGNWEPLILNDDYYDFLTRMHVSTNGLLEYEDYRAFLEKYLDFQKIKLENQTLSSLKLAEKFLKGESLWLFQAKDLIVSARTGKVLENSQEMTNFQSNCTYASLKTAVFNISNESKGIKKGMKAPDFELHDAKGNLIKLADLRGRIVFLDFWATWCEHCIEEMPNLQNLTKQFDNQGVEMVFVSFDKDQNQWKNFVNGLEGTHVWGETISNSMVSKMYGVRALPVSFVLDRDGNIIKAESGGTSLEITRELIEKENCKQ